MVSQTVFGKLQFGENIEMFNNNSRFDIESDIFTYLWHDVISIHFHKSYTQEGSENTT